MEPKGLAPPHAPVDAPSDRQLSQAADQLGIRLPNDYCQFAKRYGVGSIGAELVVFIPYARNRHRDLLRQVPRILSGLSALKAGDPDDVRVPLHHEPGGFLPWGVTNNGDYFGWLTEGPQGRWKTCAIWRHSDIETWDMGFRPFIENLLEDRLETNALGDEALLVDATFRQDKP